MTAVPDEETSPKLRLRVPVGHVILVRDWLIDGQTGTPHRLDSWRVEVGDDGAKVRFLYGEPESYL